MDRKISLEDQISAVDEELTRQLQHRTAVQNGRLKAAVGTLKRLKEAKDVVEAQTACEVPDSDRIADAFIACLNV